MKSPLSLAKSTKINPTTNHNWVRSGFPFSEPVLTIGVALGGFLFLLMGVLDTGKNYGNEWASQSFKVIL